jgi:hypothetical protein
MTGQDTYQGHGKVVAFCDAPMVLIEPEEGLHRSFWWRLDLCKEMGPKGLDPKDLDLDG